jgi:hypothetical protein
MPFPRLLWVVPIAVCLCSHPLLASTIELTNIRTFSVPFGAGLADVAINDNGDIAGSSFYLSTLSNPAGFLLPRNGAPPIQIDYPGATDTYVQGINNQGAVVGYAFNSTTIVGFTEIGGTFTPVTAGALTYSDGINNNGDITGYAGPGNDSATGFLLKNGVQTNFGVPGYPFATFPLAINDSDQITGYYKIFRDYHDISSIGFLRNPDGSFQFFGFQGYGINDAGIIVGTGPGPNDMALADVRIDGTTYTYQFPGASETSLYGINNHNEVVGIESQNGFNEMLFEGQLVYANTPEPSTLSFCAFALGALLVVGWRRRSWY